MASRCIVLGGGGHARVVIDALQRTGLIELHGILDVDVQLWGSRCLDVAVLGGDDLLVRLREAGVDRFVVGLGGVGDTGPRRRLFEQGCGHGLEPLTVLHPDARWSSHAGIGAGAQLLPGCIVNAGAEVGVNTIVNSGAIIEHDCRIGDHVHVASGAILAGGVRVGDCAHIGAGAVVRQGVTIGDGAVVGAGAVVIADVGPEQTVIGNPARAWDAKGAVTSQGRP